MARPHEEFRIALAAEALDALSGPERAELLAHLGECDACTAELAELRGLAVALDDAVPPARLDPERSARMRARLVERAAADAGSRVLPLRPPRPRRVPGWVTAGSGWLVAAGLAALLLTHHSFHRPLSMGWVVAAALGIALFSLGVYAVRRHREAEALRRRLAEKDAPRL